MKQSVKLETESNILVIKLYPNCNKVEVKLI
jgi:hypothetical protein